MATFTPFDYTNIKPQPSAIHNLVGDLLGSYKSGIGAKYLPQEKEADIFAKQLGPLATLSTNPMFLQNPQFQAALGNLVSQALGHFGKGFEGVHFDTYAGQRQKEAQEAQQYGQDLSKGGQLASGASSLAGTAENKLGDFGKWISGLFSGGKVDSKLAQEENKSLDILSKWKSAALQAQTLTPQEAEKVFKHRSNETWTQTFERGAPYVPGLGKNWKNDMKKTSVSTGQSSKAPSNVNMKDYDIPEGWIMLYDKKGKPHVFPPELVDQKLNEGYNYE